MLHRPSSTARTVSAHYQTPLWRSRSRLVAAATLCKNKSRSI